MRAALLKFSLALAFCASALSAQAQVAFRAAGAQVTGTGSSITPTIPGGTQSGDLAVLVVAGRPTDTSQPTAPSGWTLRSSSMREVGANDLKVMTFYRFLTGSVPNPVVSLPAAWQGSAAGMSAQIAVWSGVNATTPFDAADVTGNAAAATTWTPPAITTVTAGAMVVSVVATSDDNALSIGGIPWGFTASMSGANYDTTTGGDHSVAVADKVNPVGLATLLTWNQTANASDHWAGITFALRPANAAPIVTLTSPTEGAAFAHPASITLSATASDSNGTIARVEFRYDGAFGETETFTITQPPYSMVWNPFPAVPPAINYWYTVSATAYDNQGAMAGTAVTIYVDAPPEVSIASPVPNATFAAPASIPLQAQASDVGGSVSSVEFYHGTTLITTLTSAPYTFNWTGVPAGTYSLTARAIDNLGLPTTSTPVNVTVTGGVAKLHFVHVDHLNTPRAIYDDQQQLRWRWDQREPFGSNGLDENPSNHGVFELPLRLSGQYFDKETNLHYNYFRDYDPGIGRYAESDPVGLKGGLNTYSYVGGRPLSAIDPRGLQVQSPEETLAPPSGPRTIFPETMVQCGRRVAGDSFQNSIGLGWPGERRDDTAWNAYLHCLWSCDMVNQCGYAASLGVGTMHELWDDGRVPAMQNWPASRNDLHNNREGRDCATNPDCMTMAGTRQSCHVCCSTKLGTGKLMYQ